MRGLDLFSGIAGITKALEGYVRPVAYCEIDRYAQGVLLSRMGTGDLPLAPIWDDIRTLDGRKLREVAEIIYGGFPCQDISVAGCGAGLAGERSGLFFEIVRLVREIRPRFVFLENVPAITTRGGVRVASEFAALRFDCRWGLLSAADVGANHLRERWWLLAHANSDGSGSRRPQRQGQQGRSPFIEPSSLLAYAQGKQSRRLCVGKFQPDIRTSSAVAESESPKREGNGSKQDRESSGLTNPCWWSTEPDVGRVAHGIPLRVDRLRGLGNAVVPLQAREAFERLMGLK